MYTKEIRSKYFSAIPIYNLINDKSIELTQKEEERVEKLQKMSTKVLVGKEFGISEMKKNYFFINNLYYDLDKNENNFCDKLNKYSNREIYKYIENSNSITFIGDSITERTRNEYHPWYEPMIKCFTNKKIINISKGSYTTRLIIRDFKNDIIESNSDLYIIALGTNDVRYRRKEVCAMDEKEYIKQLEKIVDLAKNTKEERKFVFIAPWFSTFDDKVSRLNHSDKKKMMKEYSFELEKFSKKNNYIFIDTNDYLEKIVTPNKSKYLLDFIHPNNQDGIELYSEGLFVNSK